MKKIAIKIPLFLIIVLVGTTVYGLQRARFTRGLQRGYARKIPSTLAIKPSLQCPKRSREYTALPTSISLKENLGKYFQWFDSKPILNKKENNLKETLFAALHEKVTGSQGIHFIDTSINELIQMFAQANLINAQDHDGKTPLLLILESTTMDKTLQKSLILALKRYGADFGLDALKIAVDSANSDIVEILQPEYGIKDLYPEFKKIINTIKETLQTLHKIKHLPNMAAVYKSYLNDLRKIARILDRVTGPTLIALPVFKDGKEHEEIFTINSVSELDNLITTYQTSYIRYL